MKTAISIPDEIYEAAERTARQMRVSRSRLYAEAVQAFVEKHRRDGITAKLDDVYGKTGSDSVLDPGLADMQAKTLSKEDWS